jgi:hypothetical protein
MIETALSSSKHAPVVPSSDRPVIAQVGWLGATGTVYALDDQPLDGREPGAFSPLYIRVGTWENTGGSKTERPPTNLREQVGQLLDVHSVSRQVYDQLRRGRWDEIGVDIDLVDALGVALAAADDPTREE